MTEHIETGKKGELLAACWLIMHGFQILFRNWRQGHGEIDIIALKKGVFHIIEVKTGRTNTYGYPEGRINNRKMKSILRTTNLFLRSWPYEVEVQFDILSVLIQDKEVNYLYFEDAFSAASIRERKLSMF